MNILRKHFSQVKGGRLALAAQPAAQCTILISDVPHDALHVVGSGPSLPDPSTVWDCRQILESSRASLPLSPSLVDFFLNPSLPETPKPDHPAFLRSQALSLLSSDDLCAVAVRAAASKGFHVTIDNSCDEWDYRDAAEHLLRRVVRLREEHPLVCLFSAGEVSVPISADHGTGGRNQQFVLECARLLAERGWSATVLSAGSDGIDGNSLAAGGICDESTAARAAASGIDIAEALAGFDSAKVFCALEDSVVTGPTGHNVRDLRILLSTMQF
jgi:hydroxypyruvate reductase